MRVRATWGSAESAADPSGRQRAAASLTMLRRREDRSVRLRVDRLRRLHLFHQVVVPLAFDFEVRGGAEFDSLDEVVRKVGVDARLTEGIERRKVRELTR